MSSQAGFFWRKHRNRLGLTYFLFGLGVGICVTTLLIPHPSPNTTNPSVVRAGASASANSLSLPSDSSDEWNSIHVFTGDSKHISAYSTINYDHFIISQWFSQARQDEVVAALLRNKKGGYFVDLASNDAIKISNTYALENNFGWRGLCLEPNPVYWASLSYRKCTKVSAVVGSERMQEVQFKFPNRFGPKGGIVGKEFDNKEPSKFNEDKPRYTIPLLEIFKRFNTPSVIDYLSLDVEGAEDLVMSSFPFDQYQFNIITLERPSSNLQELLKSHGYQFERLLKKNSGDTLWIHKSMSGKLDVESACKIDSEGYFYHEGEDKKNTSPREIKDSYC
mmetsp:Transcript_27390/g.40438  ORF Transcript_27390/g.40438 Transcript_27390/m.40438 type:complete len:335 (+) Transcript_27390:89-1093(+)